MKVLAAVDFGDASLEALRQARALTHAVQGELAGCHVLPAASHLSLLFPERSLGLSPDLLSEEKNTRTALLEHARDKLGLELPELFIERGAAYAEVVRRAETWQADYIVVGSHGRSGLARVVLGSVAESIVRHAHCSVLIARPVRTPGVVLAATDLSEASMPALSEAAAAARRSGARLVVVSAIEWANPVSISMASFLGSVSPQPSPELQREVRGALQTTLEQTLTRLGIVGEARVLEGSPASEIVQCAEELSAELVVVGTRGHTGLARLALGSVAERVVGSVHCSVLAARAR